MDLTTASYYSVELQELLKTYLASYKQQILVGLLIIAILNCFFGYHLRKLWGILAGMVIGALVSAGICIYIEKTGTILYLAAIAGAFVLGLLALLLYRVGLFFFGTLTVPLVLTRLFPTQKLETLILWIILGLVVSTMALVWEREIISLITAIGGGFGTTRLLMLLRAHNSSLMLFMLGIILSLAGILLQFQPWRSRSAWNSDEGRARDKHRHKRRMKRIRQKQRRQERLEKKKGHKKRSQEETVVTRSTTEYTPYTTRPIYQNRPLPQKQPIDRDIPLTDPADDETFTDSSANPDLSNIRQMISKEVSDIYMEKQQDMDQALDELLEKEYRHTTNQLKKR